MNPRPISNPPNPWDSATVDWLGDPPPARPRIYADANVPAGLVAYMRNSLGWDVLFVMEEEELRRVVADLETALFRQVQLRDFAPAGLFEVDRSTALCGLNRMGAQLLGFERDAVIGRTLDSFLEPDSSRALHSALTRVAESATSDGCALRFAAHDGVSKTAYACVGPDPAGRGFLIACVEIRGSGGGASI